MTCAALIILGVAAVLWLAFEVWRAPLCCFHCEMPLEVCCCSRFQNSKDHSPVNESNGGRDRVVCASCKRDGKKSPRVARRCSQCDRIISKLTEKENGDLCGRCAMKKRVNEREDIAPVVAYTSEFDLMLPDSASFGGFPWGSANANPVL